MKQRAVKNHLAFVYDGKPTSFNSKNKKILELFKRKIASCYDWYFSGKLTQDKLYATVLQI